MADNLTLFERVRAANPELPLYSVTDEEFSDFGNVIETDISDLLSAAKSIPTPDSGVRYMPSLPEFEKCASAFHMENVVFGGINIQIGYCWGFNNCLNALEWHKCSEVDIAVTPLVLLLGKQQDIKNGRYDSANIKGFLMETGQAVELFATSLHYTPCQVMPGGFGCIVILPKGTNTILETSAGDGFLFAKNKWLIAHNENTALLQRGSSGGIFGENKTVSEV